MDANDIIIEPILTEKSNALREGKARTYVFKVHKSANKSMVRQALETIFKVRTTQCRIMNVRGKVHPNRPISRRSYRRGLGRTAAWKKALVTLAQEEKIEIFEGS